MIKELASNMKKSLNLIGQFVFISFVMLGCATGPSFKSMPENSPISNDFVGTWVGDLVEYNYSGLTRNTYIVGQQYYIFFDDGTGEIYGYKDGRVSHREVFRYRVSGTTLGFQVLNRTVFTGGGTFSRQYNFSFDKNQIHFPDMKDNILRFYDEYSLTKVLPTPEPHPTIVPERIPVNNAGTVFYSYDGRGYVYIDNSVFYLCSNGRPVGYIEDGVIYAFKGNVLGFFDGSFIYTKNGYPIGAANPKSLGVDASDKKSVTKANKQNLPDKESKAAVNRPRLRNGYYGGVLSDIF